MRYPFMTLTFRLILLFALLGSSTAMAQLVVQPHGRPPAKSAVLQRGADAEILSLPFWDDFSTGGPSPDTAYWLNSQNVYVNDGIGINPPTINVATFDGVDATGRSYSNDNLAYGPADSLASCPIDLQAVADVSFADPADTEAYRNSLILSWYWQLAGNGERPDAQDSLQLELLSPSGIWVRAWSVKGDDDAAFNAWNYEEVQISDTLLHQQFRFRFTAYSRRTGNFDEWHLDYIYMNVGRTPGDANLPDRAVVTAPGSIFGEYSAIPRRQFNAATSVAGANLRVYNQSARNLYPIRTVSTLTNLNTNTVLETLQDSSRVINSENALVFPLSTPNGAAIAAAIPENDTVDLKLKLTVRLTSGDTLLATTNPITDEVTYSDRSLEVNDTISRTFTIGNYYAYDDGTAEYVAGMATIGGAVAYQYHFAERDTITHIDAYFPAVKGNLGNSAIELVVWKRLDNAADSELSSLLFTLTPSSQINTFVRYPLPDPVPVVDTVYIGWRQQTSNFIGVGLDKSSNSGGKIYGSTRGVWSQNTLVSGNLMLRPVMDTVPQTTVTSLPDFTVTHPKIYPNPTTGDCYVEGNFSALQIIDTFGRQQSVNAIRESDDRWWLDTRALPAGMYLLRLTDIEGKHHSYKLLKTDR